MDFIFFLPLGLLPHFSDQCQQWQFRSSLIIKLSFQYEDLYCLQLACLRLFDRQHGTLIFLDFSSPLILNQPNHAGVYSLDYLFVASLKGGILELSMNSQCFLQKLFKFSHTISENATPFKGDTSKLRGLHYIYTHQCSGIKKVSLTLRLVWISERFIDTLSGGILSRSIIGLL